MDSKMYVLLLLVIFAYGYLVRLKITTMYIKEKTIYLDPLP
jgi:hypothetical protein